MRLSLHAPSLFVLSCWLLMTVAGSILISRYASHIPRADDWTFVPGVLNRSLDLHWVWEQTADHRVPLTKLLMWALWQMFPGNLMVPMLISFLLLSLGVLYILLIVAHARGSTAYSDVYFPVLLLTFGHAGVFLWWTTTGVAWFVALASVAGILVIVHCNSPSRVAFTTCAVAAIALPCLGSPGVAFSLPLVGVLYTWCLFAPLRKVDRITFAAITTVAFGLIVMCIVSFDSTKIQSPSISLARAAQVTMECLTMGLGYGAQRFWPVSAVVPVGLVCVMLGALIRRLRAGDLKAWGAAAVILALLSPVGVAAAVGYGRQYQGALLERYILYAAPFYCISYVFLVRFEMSTLGKALAHGLCFFATAGLFWGFSNGLAFAKQNKAIEQGFIADISDGVPLMGIVARSASLLGVSEIKLESELRRLRERNIWPYNGIKNDPPWRSRLLSPRPVVSVGTEQEDNKWKCNGKGSQLVFALNEASHVYAIRFRFILWSRFGSTKFRVRTLSPGPEICLIRVNEIEITKEFNQAKPRRIEQQTVWINERITSFALSPSDQPCEFELQGIEVFLKSPDG